MSDDRRWSDDKLSEFYDEFVAHRASFDAHRTEVHNWLAHDFPDHAAGEEARLKRLEAAFPPAEDGKPDYYGHRRSHESAIRAAQEQEKFWRELRLEVAKKGAIAILVLIVGLMMAGLALKTGIGATPPGIGGPPP